MVAWTGRTVAITGATGFVGHHAALELHRQGAKVVALVRPSSDVQRLRAAGITCRIAPLDDQTGLARSLVDCELVFHLAGAVGFDNDWQAYYRVNVQGTQNLLEAARLAGVRRFVHTSSIAAVGGSATPRILDETVRWDLRSYRVPYVTTKRLAEENALAANGRGLEVVVVNPGSVVGPDDFADSEFGTLCRRFWKGRIPFYFGGGNNFVDVRDVAQGIRLAAERGRPGERYLLTGDNRTYQGFFRDLAQAAQRTIPRLRLPNVLASVIGFVSDRLPSKESRRPYLSSSQAALMGMYFFFDASKARRELGYNPRPLRQALADAHAFWMGCSSRRALSA
jgi:dihydroflavonol-4-reductase